MLVKTRGEAEKVRQLDAQLIQGLKEDNWFVRETVLLMKQVLKRMDLTAKSFFTLIDEASCFVGSLLELAWASDRAYMLDCDGVAIGISDLNAEHLPMSNGLTRLQTRMLHHPEQVDQILKEREAIDAAQAENMGLITLAIDDLDWEDEIPFGHRRARQSVSGFLDRYGSLPTLCRTGNHGNQDLWSPLRLAKLDFPTTECGRPTWCIDSLWEP